MFARLQNAANDNQGASSSSNGRGGGRGSGRNVAGSALRRAGLIDDDVGMRSASSSGPSRSGRGRGKGRGAGPSAAGPGATAGPSRIQIDDDGATGGGKTGKARKARDRANPLAGRLSRPARPGTITGDANVSGQVFAIRGAANAAGAGAAGGGGKGKGKGGRVPGGGANGDHAPSSSFNTQGTIGVLRRFLAARWNGSANFLNLDNMKADNILKESNVIAPGQPGAHKDIGAVMWKLAAELYPGLTTLSMGNNDLKNLAPLAALPQHLPNIQNLSLEGNDLKWAKDLTTFSKNKNGTLKNLRELMLTGNPMQANAAAAMNEEGYRAEVLSHFPTLTLLDRVPVTPKEQAIAQLPSSSKGGPSGKGKGGSDPSTTLGPDTPTKPFSSTLHIKPGFSDPSAESIVPTFLAKFFQLYDSQRDSADLRAAYASNATFSHSLNQRVSPRSQAAGYLTSAEMPRQRDLNWHGYTGKGLNSHDIMSLGSKSASKGFPVGANAIMAVLAKMPKTTHPLNDASKFVVDSWLLPNQAVGALVGADSSSGAQQNGGGSTEQRPEAVLFINVKGEYQEHPSMGYRSFDRTFIVAPSAPGSTAANAGWPCVILSEQLTVRHYSGTASWRPGTLASGDQAQQALQPQQQQGQPSAAAPGSGPQPPPGINEQQHFLSLEFARQTGLTYPFALQCLQENGWQPQAAMEVFQNLKGQGAIPQEAFGPVA